MAPPRLRSSVVVFPVARPLRDGVMRVRVDSKPEGDSAMASDPIRRMTIREVAEDHLRRSGYLALRDISCEVREGVARMQGRLPTYYLKQVAQAIVAEVEGVDAVINQIEVTASGNGSLIERGALVPAESSSEVQAEPPTRKEPGTMLVLGRKVHEKIAISDRIRITVVSIHGNRVRLGVEAPENIKVIRDELFGPGDAGPEAGELTVPRPPDVQRTDVEPRGRSRRKPRRR